LKDPKRSCALRLSQALLKCLQRQKDVDYLLMAKPVAINHLRIRRDCCKKKCHHDIFFCRLLVVLYEDHDLCYFVVTRRNASEICETEEHGGFAIDLESG
jgi:hypothetical protein